LGGISDRRTEPSEEQTITRRLAENLKIIFNQEPTNPSRQLSKEEIFETIIGMKTTGQSVSLELLEVSPFGNYVQTLKDFTIFTVSDPEFNDVFFVSSIFKILYQELRIIPLNSSILLLLGCRTDWFDGVFCLGKKKAIRTPWTHSFTF
jgi:hypothetical protein